MQPAEGWPIADEPTVKEGLERLRVCFEVWINERADADQRVNFIDGMMVAHNFYKLVLSDLMDRQDVDEGGRAAFAAVMLKRLGQTLLSPEESAAAERKMRDA